MITVGYGVEHGANTFDIRSNTNNAQPSYGVWHKENGILLHRVGAWATVDGMTFVSGLYVGGTISPTTLAGLGLSADGISLVTAVDYAAMRALLDLEAGTDFLAYPTGTPTGAKFLRDDNSWQVLSGGGDLLAANNLSELTASASTARTNLGFSANGSSLITAANYAAMRTLLDLEAGTDFYSISAANAAFDAAGAAASAQSAAQSYAAALVDDLSGVSSASTARTNLGFSANGGSLVTAADYAAMRTLLDLEAGTDFLAYPTGTPTGAKFLRDDNSWQVVSGGGDLLAANNLSDLASASTALTNLGLSANGISLVTAADYAAMRGLLDLEAGTDFLAYPTGTPTGAKFLRDDNSWQTVSGGGDLLSTNNLSDLASASTALMNLGLSANGSSLVTAADYAAMRTLLDLEAGTDFYSKSAADSAFQPLDATLTALAGLTIAANTLTIGTGADAFSQTAFAANTFPARASAGDLAAKTISDFALTILDDADAASVRTTIGAGTGAGTVTSFSAGDLSPLFTTSEATATTTPALTFSLSTAAANTALRGPTSGSAAAPTYRADTAADIQPETHSIGGLVNATFVAGASGGALTIELKTYSGANPSAADPARALFRSATASSGARVERLATTAASLTIPSGATLGMASGIANKAWVVLIDDAGTLALGVTNCRNTTLYNEAVYPLAEGMIVSTTAIGTGSDSTGVIYSTSAITSKPIKVLGSITWNPLTTAGTYTTPDEIRPWSPGVPLPGQYSGAAQMVISSVTVSAVPPLDTTAPTQAETDLIATRPFATKDPCDALEITANYSGSPSASQVYYGGIYAGSNDTPLVGQRLAVVYGAETAFALSCLHFPGTTSSVDYKVRGGAQTGSVSIETYLGSWYYRTHNFLIVRSITT